MFITLAFVALGCRTIFEGIRVLVSVASSRLLPLMSSLCEGVWVLDLWGLEGREGLGTEVL